MFAVNHTYSKNDIYAILNVPQAAQRGAWDTGYRKYEEDIYIFANIGVAGRTGHYHHNRWDKGDLVWFSKSKATPETPLVLEMIMGASKVHIFTRGNSSDPFTYQGIGKAKSVKGSQPVQIRWSLNIKPAPSVQNTWQAFVERANKSLTHKEIFYSGEGEEYNISAVTDDYILIHSTIEEELTRNMFYVAIGKLDRNHRIRVGTLLPSAAMETTLVWFISTLDWDEEESNIISVQDVEIESSRYETESPVTEARDDDQKKTILTNLRLRKGQKKLRDNLFKLYGKHCCITGSGVEDTLHACHIIPHSKSGNNQSTNALLLRSDIHDLFDADLLGINPDTLKISVKAHLKGSLYEELDGKTLLDRSDGKRPDFEALRARWIMFLNLK